MSNAPQFGLNGPQSEAVLYLDGPALVLAGAGSGKTRVITQKITHMIEDRGYDPRTIAALTFTNKAALEMQERVGKMLKQPRQAKQLTVCTFHSLGVRILRQECNHLGLKDRFSIMDSDDCYSLVQDLAITTDKHLIRSIQNDISLWKNGLVTPEEALKQAQTEDEAQSARIYGSYIATLAAYQAVDFDDLIRLPVELFRNHDIVRDKWQRRLRYLMIDEYQDTNTCQYELVKLMVTGLGKKPMFTAVGDDDQAIYGWRGATMENLALLQVDFPDLRLIKLEQNYRSTTRILQAANAVIQNNPKLFEKSLWSELGIGEPIKVHSMPNEEQEAEQVAIMISADHFERKNKWADYAILYRGNHQARVIEQALRTQRIPYTISGGQSFFDKAEIKDIMAYLRLMANPDDDPAFIRAATTPRRGIGQSTLEALGSFSGKWQCSLFEAVFKGGIEAVLNDRQLKPLQDFCNFILELESRATRPGPSGSGDNAAQVLDDLMEGMHYEHYLYDAFEERAAQGKWENVMDFVNWLKDRGRGGKDRDGEEKNVLELTQMVALMSMLDGKDEEPDAIRMSTLHASKGLEYPHVFLVGVEEGILPHKGDPDAPVELLAQRIEEERRLMYVGITRAQRTLQLTWCKKRKRGGEHVQCDISRFIAEMALDVGTAPPTESEVLSPRERLARMKELLSAPRDINPA
ncbi:ATP-dependent DNA helicase Rep [Duganella sp. CF458]|uniref:UvrD-helicase domain-containing protein n=1 Tax=Duganella sp. CF458 TaxID=1884368 RepID=UPI0008EC8E0F|nr:UvrD-helicase domain-containing protein [Duganella sp. CF458]SFF62986.1 ATP-dependent DNA helicase Rep [Duganella sp. CF458]